MPKKPSGHIERSIGAKIRQQREALGISQINLAEAIHMSFQQVQKYEMGTNKITASTLLEIAYHLEVPVAWFYEDLCLITILQERGYSGKAR